MNDLNGGSAIAIPRYMRCNSNVCNSSRQARAPKDGDLPLTRVDTPPSARKDTSRTLSNTTRAEASTRPSSHSLPIVSICDIKEAHSDDRRGSQHFFWSQSQHPLRTTSSRPCSKSSPLPSRGAAISPRFTGSTDSMYSLGTTK
jgi:hypothetical protein